MQIETYYAELKSERQTLDRDYPNGFCYTTSTDRFKSVAEVPNAIAAKGLVENKMRISTPEEIAAHEARGRAFNEKMQAQHFNRVKRSEGGVVHLIRG